MAETISLPSEAPRRLQLNWVPLALFKPRAAFTQIVSQGGRVWLTPMLVLTLTSLVRVVVTGYLRQQAALAGGVTLPLEFQYFSPEQQAQFMQAMQATQGPVFLYVFPAITALLGVWMGWLLVSGLLHLVLTLLGGRGDTSPTTNLVAWASLPFALRDIVRIAVMWSSKQLIQSPGLAGFAPADASGGAAYLAVLLALVDLYVFWHILLLVVGVRTGNGLAPLKTIGGVVFTLTLVLGLQALLSFLTGQLSGLTIIRPFF
jgi:hypothetical protein